MGLQKPKKSFAFSDAQVSQPQQIIKGNLGEQHQQYPQHRQRQEETAILQSANAAEQQVLQEGAQHQREARGHEQDTQEGGGPEEQQEAEVLAEDAEEARQEPDGRDHPRDVQHQPHPRRTQDLPKG